MKKFLLFFQILLVFPIILIFIFLRIFLKIKIIEFETRAIGHSSLPMEVFLCEKLNGIFGKNNIYFAYRNRFISNMYLYQKLKKNFILLPNFILRPIFLFFNYKIIYVIIGKFFVSDYRHWSKRANFNDPWQENDIYQLLPKTAPIINFNSQEIIEGRNYLKNLGVNKNDKYVCFHHRSPHYYFNKKIITEFKYILRDLRNHNFGSTYKYLLDKKSYSNGTSK